MKKCECGDWFHWICTISEPSDTGWGAVELHQCPNCKTITTFSQVAIYPQGLKDAEKIEDRRP